MAIPGIIVTVNRRRRRRGLAGFGTIAVGMLLEVGDRVSRPLLGHGVRMMLEGLAIL
jgi:hypothetical protein